MRKKNKILKGIKGGMLLSVLMVITGCLLFLAKADKVKAYEWTNTILGERIALQGYLKNDTLWRMTSPNDFMKFQWQARVIVDGVVNSNVSWHLDLKYFYDAVYDIEDDGIAAVPGSRTQFGSTDQLVYQDYLREGYIDYRYNNWFVRGGKQQVVWGKADGLRLLDVVNAFDWSDWTIADFSENRIPSWMMRIEREFPQVQGNFQVLWLLNWQHGVVAHAYTPWSFNAVNVFQGFEDAGAFRWKPNLWTGRVGGSCNSIQADKMGFGFRWMQQVGQFQYTLNYLNKFSDYVFAFATKPLGATIPNVYNMEGRRIQILGASFDYNWDCILGMQNLVARGEFAYYIHDLSYAPQGHFEGGKLEFVQRYDHIDYVLGLDKYFFEDWWFSVQFWQTILPRWQRDKAMGLTTFGLEPRKHYKWAWTLFVMKDFGMLPGGANILAYYDPQNSVTWLRQQTNYELIRNKLAATLTFQYFSDNDPMDTFGDFWNNDCARLELKYMFK